jgi:hypothetical protein
MKQTVSKSDFIDQFRVMDRLENFSYEARGLLFDYLEEYEEDTGEELEMDVIAVCCEYSEDSPEDITANYGVDLSECADDDAKADTVREYLEENTVIVGETAVGFVYAAF